MVRGAAVAASGEDLVEPQSGRWVRSRYRCTYRFIGGSLLVTVDVERDQRSARQRYSATKRSTPVQTKLYGIGQQGFEARDGRIVARKDNFILTVDPRSLPTRLRDLPIAWSTTRAVFDCW